MLANGPAPNNNGLMNKVSGISHTGGNQCSGGLMASPCKEIVAWWNAEFGGTFSGRYVGQVYYVTSRGTVDGWVVDSQNTGLQLTAYFFDGALPGGTPIGTSVGNLSGPAGSYPGNHVFSYTLPPAYRNGTPHNLHVYIREAEGDFLLQGTPLAYTAYTPKAQAYFDSTVAPSLNSAGQCGTCHTRGYLDSYNYLIDPLPSSGGTALNNTLINKGAGSVGHNGGNRCGGKNAGVCLLLQEWWRREFQ